MSVTLTGDAGECSLDVAVRNVVEPARPPERLVFRWRLKHNDREVVAERQGFDSGAKYRVTAKGEQPQQVSLGWRGLLPRSRREGERIEGGATRVRTLAPTIASALQHGTDSATIRRITSI